MFGILMLAVKIPYYLGKGLWDSFEAGWREAEDHTQRAKEVGIHFVWLLVLVVLFGIWTAAVN